MSAFTDAQSLSHIPLFRDLPEEKLEAIHRKLRTHVFPAESNVITFQTPGEVVYIILSGTLKIKIDQQDGKEVIIAILGPGELVGELSVLDNDIRSADVITQEASRLAWMDRAAFVEFMQGSPTMMLNLVRILTRRVRLSTEQIQALGTLDVMGKVARQLLVFAEQYGIETKNGTMIPMRLTQTDIAGMVGASRERVNQVFMSLRNQKYISETHDHRIVVIDLNRTRSLLEKR